MEDPIFRYTLSFFVRNTTSAPHRRSGSPEKCLPGQQGARYSEHGILADGGQEWTDRDYAPSPAVRTMNSDVEGRPCVNVGGFDGGASVCRISGLGTDEDCFNGRCDWVDRADARPDELTDEMAIKEPDRVRLGPGWRQDTYFGWYFVTPPRSPVPGRDHSWVRECSSIRCGQRTQSPIDMRRADEAALEALVFLARRAGHRLRSGSRGAARRSYGVWSLDGWRVWGSRSLCGSASGC